MQDKTNLITEAKKFKSAEEFVEGQPKVFHGSGEDFGAFDTSQLGRNTGVKSANQGVFFSDNKKVAETYARQALSREQTALQKEYNTLSAKDASVGVDSREADRLAELQNKLNETYGERIKRIESGKLFVKEKYLNTKNYKVYDAKGNTTLNLTEGRFGNIVENAKKEGYTGLIVKNVRDTADKSDIPSTVYAVFDTNTIKSKL